MPAEKGYTTCPDCGVDYEIGAPHTAFCEARTCDECSNTVGYVMEKGEILEGKRVCDICADHLNFPEDDE